MAGRDIIVVGTSAGGVQTLEMLVQGLPTGLPAAVFIVCHMPAGARSALPELLSRRGHLLARHARDGEPIYPGHIYVAPPDHHLVVMPDAVGVHRGPSENRLRPAIDPLFRSAARAFGERVIGVILSGGMGDGVAGLLAVRSSGGVAVVQDPADALFPELPQRAIAAAGADFLVAAATVASRLTALVKGNPVPVEHERIERIEHGRPMDPLESLPQTVARDMHRQEMNGRAGRLSVYTCPDCGGALWQTHDNKLLRFRCHVGHAYEAETLLESKNQHLEAALWSAIGTFRERAVLSKQLADTHSRQGNRAAAERFEEEALLSQRYGDLIREYLLHPNGSAQAVEEGA